MGTGSNTSNNILRFLRDRSGNFGILTAIAVPFLAATAGVAIDVSNLVLSHNQLQDATDAAALAVATALAAGTTDSAGAPSLGRDFVSGQMANYLNDNPDAASGIKSATNVSVTETATSTGKIYSVSVSSSYQMPVNGMTRLLGLQTADIAASSSSTSENGQTETKSPLSMILALDQSGSMADNTDAVASQTCTKTQNGVCKRYSYTYVTKIEALKEAATALFDALDNADPSGKLVRTGAVSYTDVVKGQTSPTMYWGTTNARNYVDKMPSKPSGGTDATGAMTIADTAVKKNTDGSDTEAVEHAKNGNKTSDRFIVLMTDGEMTGNSSTWNSSLDKSVRKKCDTAKQDGITIFAVAFMAPDNGKDLLQYCASSQDNYFEPDTMENLVNDFKSIAQTATSSLTLLTR